MHTTRCKHRLVALGASLLVLAGIPAAAQAASHHPAMKHHHAMKHHPAMKHHHAMKHHPAMKHSKK